MPSAGPRAAAGPPAEACFAQLYEEQRGALHAYFLGTTGDAEAALDLLQETFLRAWRKHPALWALPPERRRYWLFAVARNAAVDHLRGRVAQARAYRALGWAPGRQGWPVEPAAILEGEEQVRALGAAIARLPEGPRTALVLQALGELSSGEIGELDSGLPAEVDARLSELLGRWAARQRLTPAQAEQLRLAIVAAPAAFGYDWWAGVLAPVGRVLGGLAGTLAPPASVQQPVGAGPGWWQPGWWPDPTGSGGTYRRYLRLT
jgi:RNA polymerase sigma-70 factor (ECF subfamily)